MKKILVAVDGSAGAKRAARFAADLAVQSGATLLLMNVHPTEFLPEGMDSKIDDFRQKEAAKMFDNLERYLHEPNLKMQRIFLDGSVAEMIAQVASERKIDLVVTGRRGMSAVTRAWMGSVSEHLIHICQQPILVVP